MYRVAPFELVEQAAVPFMATQRYMYSSIAAVAPVIVNVVVVAPE